jgi:uncharacterized protein YuzE
MATRKLDKTEWRSFFDGLSELLSDKRVQIEVVSLDLGDQSEAEWLPFIGITYDPKDDIINVTLEGVDHIIEEPREVYVLEEEAGEMMALEIVTAGDVREIVKLRDPLMLPAPQH